ncbi:LapA family protein [Micromonospora carbonacea]|uniref:LapA family protein n=1 Tax=Micromonospora carbonacea TaxID=47853 RepID=UPI003D98BCB2
MKRSRIGGVWVTAMVSAFVLLLLLIFVLENGQRAEVSFLGAHGTPPMGVALLLAAVFGVLLVALPGTARIVQLRMLNRRPITQPDDPAGSGPTPSSTTSVIGVPLPSRSPREGG